MLATAAALTVAAGTGPALAQAPTPDPDTTSSVQPPPADPAAAAAELAGLDAAAAALETDIANAQQALEDRRAELRAADRVADDAQTTAAGARTQAETLRTQVDSLVLAAYSGARTSRLSAMLVADGPQDLLDRMTSLELLGSDSVARTTAATTAVRDADRAAAAATVARDISAAAEGLALTVQADLASRRAALEDTATQARTALTALAATASTDTTVVAQVASSQRADTGRASRAAVIRDGLVAQPTIGQITSPFGPRGGTQHGGVDIANSIGTPIWSVADGTVLDAGPASGFGQWVRVQHTDGTISVYGHIDTYIVAKGDKVAAGQQIATIGNRGESTGPHLHLEIITGAGKADPVSWLADRGVTV